MPATEMLILFAACAAGEYIRQNWDKWTHPKSKGYIECEPQTLYLHPGETGKFKIVKQSHNAKISWSIYSLSTDKGAISISRKGLITACHEGHAAVSIDLSETDKYKGYSCVYSVEVIPSDCISIAILGMPAAGKTTLLRFLQGLPEREEELETHDDGVDFDGFTYRKDDGTIVKIAKGRDISGIEYIQTEYPPLIKKSDLILFLFSLEKYNDAPKEKEEIQSRLDFLYAHLGGKRLAVFMTYKERFGDNDAIRTNKSQEVYRSYKQDISTKAYAKILDYPHHIISLKYGEDKSELKKIIDNLL